MSMHFRALAEQAAADGAIDPAEVLALRREAWPDGHIDAHEAEAILVINDHVQNASAEWTDFVVEAIVEYAINGTEPRGHVSPETADWLIERVGNDGRLDSMTELELIVRVAEKAESCPDALKTFAQVQIERAVVFGTGPTRRGGDLDAGCITASECALLRRLIFAAGSDGPARVSKAEAEMLFRIKDATLGAANSPEWERLFVQGVGNYLQGWQGAKLTDRTEAARLETFMNDRTSHVGRFFGRMAKVDGNGLASATRELFGRKGPVRDIAAEARADAQVTDPERLWLDARIDADSTFDPLEQALLRFLQQG
ncbi:MAG: hypothetical protein RIS94_1008 [Pseudomonadota bacterium]|jgi:hypothetical protein